MYELEDCQTTQPMTLPATMKTHHLCRAMRRSARLASLITVLGVASAFEESVRADSFVIQPVEAQSSTTFTWQGAYSADNFRSASEFSADDAAMIDTDSPVPAAWPTGPPARRPGHPATGHRDLPRMEMTRARGRR